MKSTVGRAFLVKAIAVVILIGGLAVIAYPSLTQWLNNEKEARITETFLSKGPLSDDAGKLGDSYNEIVLEETMFGVLSIPKLTLDLAIYTGPTNVNLEKGIAHLEGSSMPMGGMSTHSVLAGHNGSVTNEWFTHIDRLEVGDPFIVYTRESTLYYHVISTQIIDPDDSEVLSVQQGRDLMTLLTCTSSGDQRLIVTGERVA